MQYISGNVIRRLWLYVLMLCSTVTSICAQQQKPQQPDKTQQKKSPQKAKQQRGKASFYSRRANGARTSSGVRLNNDSLVCAHRTHPFGTLLLVKNPANGKEVVVKVIDRGPHSRGRVIDISYEAARQLGIIAAGVAVVEVSVYQDTQIPYRAPAYEAPELDIDLPRRDDDPIPQWQHTKSDHTGSSHSGSSHSGSSHSGSSHTGNAYSGSEHTIKSHSGNEITK